MELLLAMVIAIQIFTFFLVLAVSVKTDIILKLMERNNKEK